MADMREYFYSLMTDKRRGPVEEALKFILLICSYLYGLVVKILSTGYEKKIFTPYKADPKVISIGNITVGGTGKTQASITIARMLEAKRKKAAILIRGYGADEYRMLQEELRDCPILVGPDRIKSSRRAFYDFGAETVILDDGFQHWKIERDLDIVLIDAMNPFGNYRLLPRGILREPVTALKRADIIIITRTDAQSTKLEEIYKAIGEAGKASSVIESVYTPRGLYEIAKGREMGLKIIDKRKVCLVSSIGNPAYFRQKVERLGAVIELEFTFMDHYNYKKRDFYKIERECKFLEAEFIVVTKKDAVKIKRLALSNEASIPILVFDVDFEITKNKRILDEGLSGIYSN